MFVIFPYKDDNQAKSFPYLTWVIIAANLWVFFAWQFSLPPSEQATYFSDFAFIPVTFFGQLSFEESGDVLWEWATVFTSMFSHGGIAHVLGNMLFL
ncbi:MAG: rhomboid family intramembrane serine protease, partial [Opitutales bacterium]|nr:rhomboid family intramembrane serine protease [Opitutales bacterium]